VLLSTPRGAKRLPTSSESARFYRAAARPRCCRASLCASPHDALASRLLGALGRCSSAQLLGMSNPLASTSAKASISSIDHACPAALPTTSDATHGATTTLERLPPVEAAKRLAAYAAVDRHVGPDDLLIGIGSVARSSGVG